MAKYTELLSEYLAGGGELPTAFDEIDGFKDLFIGYFCDHEIGFETEELFKIKLETRANLVIPDYLDHINNAQTAFNAMINPTKTRRTDVHGGEQRSEQTNLPINLQTAQPNAIAKTDAFDNYDTVIETGFTPDEAIRINAELESKVYLIKLELLHEFDTLFMQVH